MHTAADQLGLHVRVHTAGARQAEAGRDGAGPVRAGQPGRRDPAVGYLEPGGSEAVAAPGPGRGRRRGEGSVLDAVQAGGVVRVVPERVRHHVPAADDQLHAQSGASGQRHAARQHVRQLLCPRADGPRGRRRRGRGHVEAVVRVQRRLRLPQVGLPGPGAQRRPA